MSLRWWKKHVAKWAFCSLPNMPLLLPQTEPFCVLRLLYEWVLITHLRQINLVDLSQVASTPDIFHCCAKTTQTRTAATQLHVQFPTHGKNRSAGSVSRSRLRVTTVGLDMLNTQSPFDCRSKRTEPPQWRKYRCCSCFALSCAAIDKHVADIHTAPKKGSKIQIWSFALRKCCNWSSED